MNREPIVPCARCRGTGLLDRSLGPVVCGRCRGEGRIVVEVVAAPRAPLRGLVGASLPERVGREPVDVRRRPRVA